MIITLALIAGLAIGSFVTNIIITKRTSYGTLDIDVNGEEADKWIIKFNKFDNLKNKKYIQL